MLHRLSHTIRRASTSAQPCRVRFTIEIKCLTLPFELLKTLGQSVEFSFTFQKGNKYVTSYECETSVTPSGCLQVLCDDTLSMEMTMYRKSDIYLEKKGKLIASVLTESGWQDLGKAYIDLDVIANDLQSIQSTSELEKCIVRGAILDFSISPHLLDNDNHSMASDVSEMTLESGKDSRRLSFHERLSNSIGLSAQKKSKKVVHVESPTPDEKEIISTTPVTESTTDTSPLSTKNSSSSQKNSETLKVRTKVTKASSSSELSPTSGVAGMNKQEPLQSQGESNVTELQQHLDRVRVAHDHAVDANEVLKEENKLLTRNLDKKRQKIKDIQQSVNDLEEQLSRKDTEIRAVLTFQRKLETRMTDFIAREKELEIKEKEHKERLEASAVVMDSDCESPQHLNADIDTLHLQTEVQAMTAERGRLMDQIDRMAESKEESDEVITNLRAEVSSLKRESSLTIGQKRLGSPTANGVVHSPENAMSFNVLFMEFVNCLYYFLEVHHIQRDLSSASLGYAAKVSRLVSTRLFQLVVVIVTLVGGALTFF